MVSFKIIQNFSRFLVKYLYFISIKYSEQDMALFNELVAYPQFIKNPLDTLKKHFNSS